MRTLSILIAFIAVFFAAACSTETPEEEVVEEEVAEVSECDEAAQYFMQWQEDVAVIDAEVEGKTDVERAELVFPWMDAYLEENNPPMLLEPYFMTLLDSAAIVSGVEEGDLETMMQLADALEEAEQEVVSTCGANHVLVQMIEEDQT